MSDSIQLFSLATPNGQKVSIALEEMGLSYEPHVIDITTGDQFSVDFIKVNPNSKIPAIVDPNGPGGQPINIMESGAILLYLAEKTNKFIPEAPRLRMQTLQWLFFQVAGVGPMFGQFGHFFRYGRENCDHPYPIERYTKEVKRLLGVMETQLSQNSYISGDEYTIADMATFPWVSCLDVFYKGSEHLDLPSFKKVNTWLSKCLDREAVKVGMQVCPFPEK